MLQKMPISRRRLMIAAFITETHPHYPGLSVLWLEGLGIG
jgi:hypothetical protein